MKESIFSFFNAPITNQVPNGVVCVSQLHAYITTSEWLREPPASGCVSVPIRYVPHRATRNGSGG